MENELGLSSALECLLKWTSERKLITLEEFEKLCDPARREKEREATRVEP